MPHGTSDQKTKVHNGIESKVAADNRKIRIAPSTARASIAYAMNVGAVAPPVVGMFARPPTVPSPKPPRSNIGDGTKVLSTQRDARSTACSKKCRRGLSRRTDGSISARSCNHTEATRKCGAAELHNTNGAQLQPTAKHRRVDTRALAEPAHREAAAPDPGGTPP